MKEKCRDFFKAANKAEVVYVANDKLFVDEGAARSYCAEVEIVKRAEVMAAEGGGDAQPGAAPTSRYGGSPRSFLVPHHPKLGTQPHAGYQPASYISFAYHCLFWRLLGSQSPREGDL